MKTTNMNLKLLSLTLPTLLISALLTGCGDSSSNPLEKYNGIQGGPVTNDKPIIQTVLRPDLFSLEVEGTSDVNSGQFVEGTESTVLVKITPKTTSITQYVVELTDFSNLNRPTLTATGEPGIYALTWTPPVGTIPNTETGIFFTAQIQIIVKGASNALLMSSTSSKTLSVMVKRNGKQLTLGRSDLSKGVDEGVNTVFTVDVTDPNSDVNPKRPDIQIDRYANSNTEAYRADGHKYLDLDETRAENPERKGNVYRFYFNLLVDHLPLDRDRNGIPIPAATSVPMCFLMRATSGSGSSVQEQVCTTARYAAQPPTITFREIPELKAGHEVEISFQISSAHALSIVALNQPSVTMAKLSGAKSITCNDEVAGQKNSQVCVIKWTPACITKTTNVDMLVKANSTLADKVKSSAVTKTLIVLPDLEICPIPATIKKGAK